MSKAEDTRDLLTAEIAYTEHFLADTRAHVAEIERLTPLTEADREIIAMNHEVIASSESWLQMSRNALKVAT